MVTPIEVVREVVGGKDRSLVSIGREAQTPETKELPAELAGSKIGELGDTMNGAGVKLLVSLGTAQVRLKYGEPEVVLLLIGVGLSEFLLEAGEVMLGVEKVIVAVRYDLTDQRVVVVGFDDSNSEGQRRG
jgi:hypothetical protein